MGAPPRAAFTVNKTLSRSVFVWHVLLPGKRVCLTLYVYLARHGRVFQSPHLYTGDKQWVGSRGQQGDALAPGLPALSASATNDGISIGHLDRVLVKCTLSWLA